MLYRQQENIWNQGEGFGDLVGTFVGDILPSMTLMTAVSGATGLLGNGISTLGWALGPKVAASTVNGQAVSKKAASWMIKKFMTTLPGFAAMHSLGVVV